MANILDYVRWRGDLDFESSCFNEIDNLIPVTADGWRVITIKMFLL